LPAASQDRPTRTAAAPSLSPCPPENLSIVFCLTSDSRIFLLETDSGSMPRTRQLGLAMRQMLPSSRATANASGRLDATGFDTQASSFGAVSVAG